MIKQVELLAPVGDEICLQAAIQGGARAVYFGLDGLNMRVVSRNFTTGELPDISARCHDAGVRCYLAMNTIVFQAEVTRVYQALDKARDYVDAVICWDHAIMDACRERDIPIHISTQASVANLGALRFYQRLGATRIVPARECTLEDLAAMKAAAPEMELEVFAHGAMYRLLDESAATGPHAGIMTASSPRSS